MSDDRGELENLMFQCEDASGGRKVMKRARGAAAGRTLGTDLNAVMHCPWFGKEGDVSVITFQGVFKATF